jgi:hypothetical protein
MHSGCRKTLACLVARPRVYGSGNSNSGTLLTIRARSISGPSTNNNHPWRRSENARRTKQAVRPNHGRTSARKDMHPAIAIANLPLYDWRTFGSNAQLHYIQTEDQANECVARITSRPGTLTIGLDFEWRPNFVMGRPENPIALVQIACDDEILLVQVSAIQGIVGRAAVPTD